MYYVTGASTSFLTLSIVNRIINIGVFKANYMILMLKYFMKRMISL